MNFKSQLIFFGSCACHMSTPKKEFEKYSLLTPFFALRVTYLKTYKRPKNNNKHIFFCPYLHAAHCCFLKISCCLHVSCNIDRLLPGEQPELCASNSTSFECLQIISIEIMSCTWKNLHVGVSKAIWRKIAQLGGNECEWKQ